MEVDTRTFPLTEESGRTKYEKFVHSNAGLMPGDSDVSTFLKIDMPTCMIQYCWAAGLYILEYLEAGVSRGEGRGDPGG